MELDKEKVQGRKHDEMMKEILQEFSDVTHDLLEILSPIAVYFKKIQKMLRNEGFDPNQFQICEIPAPGVFCCERISPYGGIDYFVIEETDDGILVPTYTTLTFDKEGNNSFQATSIQNSICLNNIFTDTQTFHSEQSTSNSIFISETTLSVIQLLTTRDYFSKSEENYFKRMLVYIGSKGQIQFNEWELEEIAYLKQAIHYCFFRKSDRKRFVIIYQTNTNSFNIGYFGIDLRFLIAKNLNEAIEKCVIY